MRRIALMCVAVGLFQASSASAADGPIVKGEIGKQADRLLEFTKKFPDSISGAVLVARKGEILLEKGYGLANKKEEKPIPHDALWDVASVTKQFTAAAVLKLEMLGKLGLDDTLKTIYPDVPKDKADVTLRQLLNHTSGIHNNPDFTGVKLLERDATIDYILQLPMTAKPGERWEYSNVAYFLLGGIIEKVSGQSWEQFLKEELFEPAGMKTATCLAEPDIDEKRIPFADKGEGKGPFPYGNVKSWGYCGAGGVHATARDMFQWHQSLLGEKVLSKAAKEKLYQTARNGYALGWFVEKDAKGRLKVWHGGAVPGFTCHYLRLIEEDVVVVVLTNDFRFLRNAQQLAEALLGIATDGGDMVPPESPVALKAGDLKAFAGKYQLADKGSLTVRSRDNKLLVGSDDAATVRRFKMAENAMSVVDSHATMLNEKLAKLLDALKEGDPKPLREALKSIPAKLAEQVVATVRHGPSEQGKLESYEVYGNYLVTGTTTFQFIRVKYTNGTAQFLFVWEADKLQSIAPAADLAAVSEFNYAGDGRFFRASADTWRSSWVRFELDKNGQPSKLFLSGLGQTLEATRSP